MRFLQEMVVSDVDGKTGRLTILCRRNGEWRGIADPSPNPLRRGEG
jgi:hypothetical protein